jgi:hypothetical protein
MISPKEKANDLVDTFRIILMNEDTDCGNEILCSLIAIKHAEICVEEILQHVEVNSVPYQEDKNAYQYFIEVRKELSLL